MPRPLKVLVVLLAAVLVAGVVVVSIVMRSWQDSGNGDSSPYAMVPVEAPQAGSHDCTTLIGALPESIVNGKRTLHQRAIAKPAPAASAAWGDGSQPVVLRCGLPRPQQLTPTTDLVEVSGVRWLEITDKAAGGDSVTAYAVDRPVYVALTMPSDAGTGPLQDVSAAVSHALPAVPVRPVGS